MKYETVNEDHGLFKLERLAERGNHFQDINLSLSLYS